jgi:hypothetical protein
MRWRDGLVTAAEVRAARATACPRPRNSLVRCGTIVATPTGTIFRSLVMHKIIPSLAIALMLTACASDPPTPAEQERSQFLTLPAAVRIRFEADHPNARVTNVRKIVEPSKLTRWDITYVENGTTSTTTYKSEGNDQTPGMEQLP